ncbi:unnamed protein product [Heterobilharzia americana]|nr:unnamed protein product [Heterobilharzia americana]
MLVVFAAVVDGHTSSSPTHSLHSLEVPFSLPHIISPINLLVFTCRSSSLCNNTLDIHHHRWRNTNLLLETFITPVNICSSSHSSQMSVA